MSTWTGPSSLRTWESRSSASPGLRYTGRSSVWSLGSLRQTDLARGDTLRKHSSVATIREMMYQSPNQKEAKAHGITVV